MPLMSMIFQFFKDSRFQLVSLEIQMKAIPQWAVNLPTYMKLGYSWGGDLLRAMPTKKRYLNILYLGKRVPLKTVAF